MNQLRTGIIGVGGYGQHVLKELGENEYFVVQSIADQDRELAQDLADQYDAKPFDDYRRLIVETRPDVLFLTLPTYLCADCIRLAAREKVHVFKESPLARNLPEGAEMIRAMEKAGCELAVGSRKRLAPGYLEARQVLLKQEIGKVFLIRAEQFFYYQGKWDWRADPGLAGGGVLLESAYSLVDLIHWSVGVPESVYCLSSHECNRKVIPPYRTEDTVMMTMNFSDGAVGQLTSSWMSGPETERIVYHGVEGTLDAGPNHCRLYNAVGELQNEAEFSVSDDRLISQQIKQFAECLLDRDAEPVSTVSEHLNNVSVVEAAYLSARTGMQEDLKVYDSVMAK